MNDFSFDTSLDDICNLVTVTISRGNKGEEIESTSKKEVFCRRLKITQTEFFKAYQEGLRSSICLLVDWDEYGGEKKVEYSDKMYLIYRVYERGDGYIELYGEERAGVSDG